MDDEFGAAYARSLARDHVVGALGNRSPQAALDAGTPPREVWLALCRDMDVPQERWLGKEAPAASAATAETAAAPGGPPDLPPQGGGAPGNPFDPVGRRPIAFVS